MPIAAPNLARAPLGVHLESVREHCAQSPLPRASERAVGGFEALRALHHRLAREAALGRSLASAALASGLTLAQTRALQASPAFRELVAHYRRAA